MYKVGDRITIVGSQIGVEHMATYILDEDTISYVVSKNEENTCNWYELKNHDYFWKEEWLKLIPEIKVTESEYNNVWS